jgi:putative addiction module component (TIGR02574 family)
MNYNKELLLKLPAEEKMALVGDLWDSIEEAKKKDLLTNVHRAFIKQRLEMDKANPDGAIEWDTLRKKYPI